jgi:hypothetical protein
VTTVNLDFEVVVLVHDALLSLPPFFPTTTHSEEKKSIASNLNSSGRGETLSKEHVSEMQHGMQQTDLFVQGQYKTH